MKDQIVEWAKELQSLAQAGLFYGHDVYDRERYQRIRDIAAQMMALRTDIPVEKIQDLFCGEVGYQTPKVDTRAVLFKDHKILLVRENDGRWSIPGGWCEFNMSPADNAVKEMKEEAGLDVRAERIIAIEDRKKHNPEIYAYNICKVFILCSFLGGSFQPNSETIASGYFSLDGLPPLSENKNTAAQIKMCFDACHAEHWVTQFD